MSSVFSWNTFHFVISKLPEAENLCEGENRENLRKIRENLYRVSTDLNQTDWIDQSFTRPV